MEEDWGVVDVEVALRKNRAAQAELERKINTGRARQRFVRSDPRSARNGHPYKIRSSLTYKTPEGGNGKRLASCVASSSSTVTLPNGEIGSRRSTAVHRC
jgi:hypothetical protein